MSLILRFSRCIAGDFSNAKQTIADPKNFAHIRIFFRPLPWEFFQGIGFYSEQTYDYDLWSPYRQGLHRLVQEGDSIYIENYGIKDAYLYAGAGHNLDILRTLTPIVTERRYHCSMVFQPFENGFQGRVEGNQCLIERNGRQTYLVSDVELTETTWVSLDRGMDINTDEQVWGSVHGPLRFEKRQSFADELPTQME